MLKKIIGLTISFFGLAYASSFAAIISNQSGGVEYKNGTGNIPTPPVEEPTEPLLFTSVMNVGLHKPWSSGYHRGYNYSTAASRPNPLGSLSPDTNNGYKMRALTSYQEPGYSNTVFEIDGDFRSSSDRYIESFKVEFVGFKTYVYKNTEEYYDPEEAGYDNFTVFKPDNDASIGLELNGWFSSKNGQNIDVIITELISE